MCNRGVARTRYLRTYPTGQTTLKRSNLIRSKNHLHGLPQFDLFKVASSSDTLPQVALFAPHSGYFLWNGFTVLFADVEMQIQPVSYV